MYVYNFNYFTGKHNCMSYVVSLFYSQAKRVRWPMALWSMDGLRVLLKPTKEHTMLSLQRGIFKTRTCPSTLLSIMKMISVSILVFIKGSYSYGYKWTFFFSEALLVDISVSRYISLVYIISVHVSGCFGIQQWCHDMINSAENLRFCFYFLTVGP